VPAGRRRLDARVRHRGGEGLGGRRARRLAVGRLRRAQEERRDGARAHPIVHAGRRLGGDAGRDRGVRLGREHRHDRPVGVAAHAAAVAVESQSLQRRVSGSRTFRAASHDANRKSAAHSRAGSSVAAASNHSGRGGW